MVKQNQMGIYSTMLSGAAGRLLPFASDATLTAFEILANEFLEIRPRPKI